MGVLIALAVSLVLGAEVCVAQSPGDTVAVPPLSLIELLEETRGIRVETSSAATGSVGIRIQGLPGEYTQVLVDGLPLLGTQFGELGFAQVSALGIERADVIKGPASALYGPSALGGIVNLISRPPDEARDVVLNQTSQSGTDLLAWISQRLAPGWALTLAAGVHQQGATDVNDDAWADVPGFRRIELRPRLFWKSAGGASLVTTIGGMSEARAGGTLPGDTLGDGEPFAASANTNRADIGLVAGVPIASRDTLTLRASAVGAWDRQTYGSPPLRYVQHGRHETAFSQATFAIPRGRVTWLLGAGYERDAFHSLDLTGFEYSYDAPSALAQATIRVARTLRVTANARCDWHNEYGTLCSPRAAALFSNEGWDIQLSGAAGSFAPTPFVDETEGMALGRLVPFTTKVIVTCAVSLCAADSNALRTTAPFSIVAQEARYGSLDVAHRLGKLDLTVSVFAASVVHPLILWELNPFDERPQLMNASGPTRTVGAELGGVYTLTSLRMALDYGYLHSTMISPATASRVDAVLTPRHSGSLDVAWRGGRSGTRVAVHADYTGRQVVFDDPYRTGTPSYATFSLRASQRVGVVDVYINGENLADLRQTRYDPLLTPAPSAELTRTTEVWAPLEGRVVNAGIRARF
jgi:iron complex outermembrane receptor protein